MDYHHQFQAAATGLGVPADEAARFAALLRFRIRAGEKPDGAPAGRFGGLPHLPAATPWPSVVPGAPLAYLASLECAALPRIAGLALPEAGSLLFFLSAEAALGSCSIEEEQKFARVVHVPAGAQPVATEPPADEFGGEALTGPERDLYARVEPDLPEWLDEPADWLTEDQKHAVRDMAHIGELGALVDRLWPGRVRWIGDDLVVGGYANSAQDSPEGTLADRDPGGMAAVMRDWVALAQFSVPHQEFVHGRFLIRHDDLAAGRFDRALSFCEFTE